MRHDFDFKSVFHLRDSTSSFPVSVAGMSTSKKQKTDSGAPAPMAVDSEPERADAKRKVPQSAALDKDAIAKQRAEFKSHLERFSNVCRLLREHSKTLLEMKQHNRPVAEIEALQQKCFMLFLELKQLNRSLTLKHESSKAIVQAVRKRVARKC